MNPYKVLGVRKNASQETIKKAYRKLSMKHHPDKGGDVDVMAEITAAYAILSDAKRKVDYDQNGNTSSKPSLNAQAVGVLCNCLSARMAGEGINPNTYLIRDMKSFIRTGRVGAKLELAKAKSERKQIKEVMNRLVCKNGNNIFTRQFIEKIASAELTMEKAINSVRVMRRAITLLDDYEFRRDNGVVGGLLDGPRVTRDDLAYTQHRAFSPTHERRYV